MDFITKPFDSDEVVARVSRQLEVYRKHKGLLEKNRQLASQLENDLRSGSTDSAKLESVFKMRSYPPGSCPDTSSILSGPPFLA